MGRKNSNMAAKHAKAKKEAGKAISENNYALMAAGFQLSERSKWHMTRKPTGYLTPRGNSVLRAQIVDSYHEINSQIDAYIKSGERIPGELRRQYQSIMEKVSKYDLKSEVGIAV